MRKYFLLSAVALMAATTANATTDYAEVTAKATIEVAGTFDCPEIDFGKIVVKQNNAEFEVYEEVGCDGDGADSCISVEKDPSGLQCTLNSEKIDLVAHMSLTNPEAPGKVITLNYEAGYTLIIPANITAGEYTGTTTMTVVDGEVQIPDY